MIALEDVSFAYGQKPVLQAVSLRFPKSGAVCLFGASGCGKTTLLRLLSGLEKPDKGRLTGLEGKRTAMLFQEDRLLPWLSVLENVAVVLEGPCVSLVKGAKPLTVDREACLGCRRCVRELGCPALFMQEGKAQIDASLCTGCTLCQQVCPVNCLKGGAGRE